MTRIFLLTDIGHERYNARMTFQPNFMNQFLIAMPSMADPNFAKSVTFVCQHNADGAMGIQINRVSDICLGDVFSQLNMNCDDDLLKQQPIFLGGPVSTDRGFVLHSGEFSYESSFRLSPQLSVTTSKDVLQALADNRGPKRCLIALGYAGWSEGQLEREMKENAWLNVNADADLIFDTPHAQRWEAATALIGLRPEQLTGLSGRA